VNTPGDGRAARWPNTGYAIRETADADEIRNFYDADLHRRVGARVHGNYRVDRAVDFALRHVRVDSTVLDIGCGIGIAAERIARKARGGRVVAVDISPAHIDYCQRTVTRSNVEFYECDVLRDFEKLSRLLVTPAEVVTLIDVLEHLPTKEALRLFIHLSQVLAEDGQIVLTYPSPEYQRRLYRTEGSRIQAVDRVVETEEIIALARAAGCQIRSLQYVDVWRRNQYIHCVLSKSLDDREVGTFERITHQDCPTAVISYTARLLARRLTRRWRRYRFVTSWTNLR
jgi:trans-aconitate 2-methyltransferase